MIFNDPIFAVATFRNRHNWWCRGGVDRPTLGKIKKPLWRHSVWGKSIGKTTETMGVPVDVWSNFRILELPWITYIKIGDEFLLIPWNVGKHCILTADVWSEMVSMRHQRNVHDRSQCDTAAAAQKASTVRRFDESFVSEKPAWEEAEPLVPSGLPVF